MLSNFEALEHQYQLGLESLNENLPEIKIDLVFRQQKLQVSANIVNACAYIQDEPYCVIQQFRPPLEEVRAKYYREMKKFICIPEKFGGIGDSGEKLVALLPPEITRSARFRHI